jgi:hypothetical protein
MRRLVSIAAFALALTVPVWAQRGGGMHGGGFAGRGGGSMGSAHLSGARSFGGMHSGGMRSAAGFSSGFNRGSTPGSTPKGGFHGHSNHSGNVVHHSGNVVLHNSCFGVACRNWGWGSAWWGWGWNPWLWSSWYDEDRRFDEDYYRQYEIADRWNQQSLAEQQMMRQEEADGDQDAYAPRSSNRRSSNENASQPPEPVPATILVFRDRHQQEVSNYAIVGQTLWSFSEQKTQSIPLSDLDIAATEKANDDRGVVFRVPGIGEGQ